MAHYLKETFEGGKKGRREGLRNTSLVFRALGGSCIGGGIEDYLGAVLEPQALGNRQ